MAMSVTTKITNNTGSTIEITKMDPFNDDATFTAPKVGEKIENGHSFTIETANKSVIPQGVGFDCEFQCFGNSAVGGIHLNDPAVGSPDVSYTNDRTFAYASQFNAYPFTVTISLVA